MSTYDNINRTFSSIGDATPEEVIARKVEERRRAEWEATTKNIAKPLLCDACGKSFGWVYENDLEGSRFYCDCIKNQ